MALSRSPCCMSAKPSSTSTCGWLGRDARAPHDRGISRLELQRLAVGGERALVIAPRQVGAAPDLEYSGPAGAYRVVPGAHVSELPRQKPVDVRVRAAGQVQGRKRER